MFRNKIATIVLVNAIIIASVTLMGLGVVIINPAINANAQAPCMTPQQSNTDKQDLVTIQKN